MEERQKNRPVVILIRGIPGSGKSYIAKGLQQSIGVDKVIVLDPDVTDYDSKAYADHVKALTSEGVDQKLHAYRFLRAQAYNSITAGKIIIWNQPFTNLEIFNKMVARLRAHAAQYKIDLPILVVEVEIDHVTAKDRVTKRKQAGGHGPSDAGLARFTDDYTSFAPHGYETVTVDGEDSVATSVAAVTTALQSLLSK